MTRGDIYLVKKPNRADPKRRRAFVAVSRQILIDSKYASVICAPVYSADTALTTQVAAGPDEGLKHASSIHCDGLVSIVKNALTDYLGALSETKMRQLDAALRIALGLDV